MPPGGEEDYLASGAPIGNEYFGVLAEEVQQRGGHRGRAETGDDQEAVPQPAFVDSPQWHVSKVMVAGYKSKIGWVNRDRDNDHENGPAGVPNMRLPLGRSGPR